MNENEIKMKWELYETCDFGLIVFLSLAFPIIEIKRADSKRLFFVFDKSPELIDCIDNYWRGDARVDPNRFLAQTRVIKAKISDYGN